MRKHFTTRLPDQLAQALTDRAATSHRSANAELTAILTGAAPPLSGTFERVTVLKDANVSYAAHTTPLSGTASAPLARGVVFTPSDVSTMARTLANRCADTCNVDREDYWKQYGQDCIEDAQAMVDSVQGAT